jgi:glycosyltransferase involved in cell wall biosynthesis
MSAPKYSLLLPVRNETGRIEAVVRSVFAELAATPGGDADWEICFADDRSDDGTYERLRALSDIFPFRLIRPLQNLGRGAIRNLLADEARAPILVFLDGDCRVGSGYFKAWEGLDGDCVWLGKVSYDDNPPCGFSRFLARGSGVGKSRGREPIPAAYFVSQNFRLSKALFTKAGGFRTDLLGWGGEDTDLGCKLRALGAPLRYRAEAEVRHPSVTGLEAYFARLIHFGRVNLPVLIADHPDLAVQFKLDYARGARGWLFANPILAALCRALVTGARGWPWPYVLYRYVIFNSYVRGFRQAPGS